MEPSRIFVAAPTALQHNSPKACASDTRKFHITAGKGFVLKSQAFSLHRRINGTKRAQTGFRYVRNRCGVIVKVVVVSNRVARAQPDEPIAGGLAAALIPMVKESGAIWVGSSGQVADSTQTKNSFARIESLGTGALATVDMPAKHYLSYYEGFANSGLWPALHSRADLIQVSHENYTSYREINAF